MPTYTLSYVDDGRGVGRDVKFDAADAGGALVVAQQIKRGRSAILSEGSRQLCRLERRPTGIHSEMWVVMPVDAHMPVKPSKDDRLLQV